jgi:hypothetical protein
MLKIILGMAGGLLFSTVCKEGEKSQADAGMKTLESMSMKSCSASLNLYDPTPMGKHSHVMIIPHCKIIFFPYVARTRIIGQRLSDEYFTGRTRK